MSDPKPTVVPAPSDAELAAALKVIHAAAEAAGHQPQPVADLKVLCAQAHEQAAQHPERAAEVQAAIAVIEAWQHDCRARGGA